MLSQVYYRLKPILPEFARLPVRRWYARWIRRSVGHVWPILESAGQVPDRWPGWPEGKKFAFVLSHDVEGPLGVERIRKLARLEADLGFRSSFNLVPEGAYDVPPELLADLRRDGFEVGVHDLRHDGSLFRSRESFCRAVPAINRHLRSWGAEGFRAGFMFHNLRWLGDLDIQYDASTFDTDPFEPQPDGAGTIFPFWVSKGRDGGGEEDGESGFAELPYTLPQDSTVFTMLGEQTLDLWKRKLDWIAERGGMVFLNVHPDYVSFPGESFTTPRCFPAAVYRSFLEYVKARYGGTFHHALPKDIASFVRKHRRVLTPPPQVREFLQRKTSTMERRVIWIDLDNTPHVPFFKPIARELELLGYRVAFTAREAFQVCELADQYGLKYRKIGRHYGKNILMKAVGLVWRSLQLLPFVLRERPVLGLSHGARSQVFLCNLLRIPTILIADYEHAKSPPGSHPKWEIAPEALREAKVSVTSDRLRFYPGIKEDVYAPEFRPDGSLLLELGIPEGEAIMTVRPPADEAHYRSPESDALFSELMDHATSNWPGRIVLLPRNKRQAAAIRAACPRWFEHGKTVIPERAVNGLNLLWHSDLVVSGGGTMNREAAAIGVPVYSIFRGKTGAVDRQLEQEGRLVMVRSVAEVRERIIFRRRAKVLPQDGGERQALLRIVEHIDAIVKQELRSEA